MGWELDFDISWSVPSVAIFHDLGQDTNLAVLTYEVGI